MKSILLVLLLSIAALGGFLFWRYSSNNTAVKEKVVIASFEECVEKGYPVMESYPRQCRWGETVFTEDIGNELEKTNIIRIDNPRPNQVIYSPLQVSGRARGTWYFEADFPVYLYDGDGGRIAAGIAQAQDDWMSEDFVPFAAGLNFETPTTLNGELVLEKSNPSGLEENAEQLRIPVIFAR